MGLVGGAADIVVVLGRPPFRRTFDQPRWAGAGADRELDGVRVFVGDRNETVLRQANRPEP